MAELSYTEFGAQPTIVYLRYSPRYGISDHAEHFFATNGNHGNEHHPQATIRGAY